MTRLANRLEVSSNYLARVCEALNVPHPPRGYWARRAAGEKLEVLPLTMPTAAAFPSVRLQPLGHLSARGSSSDSSRALILAEPEAGNLGLWYPHAFTAQAVAATRLEPDYTRPSG